jgi:ATP-dependent RNA helicase RhlE
MFIALEERGGHLRAFQDGKAITFATPAEVYHIGKIEGLIREKIPVRELPAHIEIAETFYEEGQEMAREIDRQKRKEDPTFKGAFHERKGKSR